MSNLLQTDQQLVDGLYEHDVKWASGNLFGGKFSYSHLKSQTMLTKLRTFTAGVETVGVTYILPVVGRAIIKHLSYLCKTGLIRL